MEVASLANRQFGGAVARTSHAIGMNSRTLLTEVDVPNPKGELFPGAYAPASTKAPVMATVAGLKRRYEISDRRAWRAEPPPEPVQLGLAV